MKFHDLNMDHVSFIYDLYEVLNVEIKNLVWKLLHKRTLILAKALPCNGDGDPDLLSGGGNYRCGGE